jgi:hypothetical protein
MKSSLAMVAVGLTVAIAGCENRTAAPETPAPTATTPATTPAPAAPAVSKTVAHASGAVPDFAAVYPDGQVEGDPLTAGGDAGPGGVVTFLTDATPDTVVAFYRERAEAAGLATMMSMNQGDARAYGALRQANGATVNVVAAPLDGKTSVQLTWSAGQ